MERWHAQATVSRVAKMSVSRWHVVFIFSALHTGHFCSSCLHSRPRPLLLWQKPLQKSELYVYHCLASARCTERSDTDYGRVAQGRGAGLVCGNIPDPRRVAYDRKCASVDAHEEVRLIFAECRGTYALIGREPIVSSPKVEFCGYRCVTVSHPRPTANLLPECGLSPARTLLFDALSPHPFLHEDREAFVSLLCARPRIGGRAHPPIVLLAVHYAIVTCLLPHDVPLPLTLILLPTCFLPHMLTCVRQCAPSV